VRGNQVFGERLRATTSNTTSADDEFPNDDFFLDIDDLFGNLNMGDNNDDVAIAANIVDAAAANAGSYVLLYFLLQILLEFLVLLFGLDAIGLSCLDAIYSSTLLIWMFSLSAISVVLIYQCLFE
jgi:hypothetical protein